MILVYKLCTQEITSAWPRRRSTHPPSPMTTLVTPASISGASDAAMRRRPRPSILRHVCIIRRKTSGRNGVLWGHVPIANHHGLAAHIRVPRTTGTAARDAAVAMSAWFPRQHQITLGTDRNSATWALVHELRALRVTPHVAQSSRGLVCAINGRTTRHPGYAVRQRKRQCNDSILNSARKRSSRERMPGNGRIVGSTRQKIAQRARSNGADGASVALH
jgi:hypothetical protein